MATFDFNADYVLENDVALIRPLRADDFEHLKGFSLHEPELWQYSLTPASGLENLQNYIASALKSKSEHSSFPFIVFDKRTGEYAGSTRFYDYQKIHNTVQLGYTWYGKKFQRTGLNRHCKLLMLEFAFEVIGVERVEFRADFNNKRSIAAMKSIGCVEEGVLRQNCASSDGRRDSIVLSILKQEWFSHVKSHIQQKIERSL
tara:strand:+ start:26207 stop:26812 length:606 start_codon:yes stop_codon:yes gene_type:complete